MSAEILFVYDTTDDLSNQAFSMMHQAISGHEAASDVQSRAEPHMNVVETWKANLAGVSVSCRFVNFDEFKKRHGLLCRDKLPAVVLKEENQDVSVLMDIDEIRESGSILSLISPHKAKVESPVKRDIYDDIICPFPGMPKVAYRTPNTFLKGVM